MARKNRPTAEIPNGSMADIAFLLLIFFLVTTTIANDKGIAMLLPPKPDPNQPPPEVTKNDRNIFKILANSQDKLLVEDEPLTDVFELREMVKSFILNFGNNFSLRIHKNFSLSRLDCDLMLKTLFITLFTLASRIANFFPKPNLA